MQKVYLLLRSNQQTGPYSLEELIQFDLKPYDLIWIEGKSAGWYYPQELPALQPYLSYLKKAPASSTPAPAPSSIEKPSETAEPKMVFVSMPSNAIKEEPNPKPSFAPLFNYQSEAPIVTGNSMQTKGVEELKTSYANSLDEVEADYTDRVHQKVSKKKAAVSSKGILMACLIVAFAFAGWKILQSSDENLGKTTPEQTAFLTEQKQLPADSVAEQEPGQSGGTPLDKQQKPQKAIIASTKKPKEAKAGRTIIQREEVITTNEPQNPEYEPSPEIKESKPEAEEKSPEPVAAEAPKEKKKLRDRIADLFKKKPEEKKEEAKPVEEENGERRMVRREAGSNLAQMVTVNFMVPNDWMLGIVGAKATLKNRSSEAIVRAVVEVVYYNDDHDILDKRTISFGNIKGKQSQTVSIPDHQTATRLEYNVVSVTGENEPFARR